MSKKDRLAQTHRDLIAEIADRLFRRLGYQQTTMSRIATEGGYSKATLYQYFSSKDEILLLLLLEKMRELYRSLRSALEAQPEATAAYFALCRELVLFSRKNPLYFEQMISLLTSNREVPLPSPTREAILEEQERICDLTASMLNRGILAGVFREELLSAPSGMVLWTALTSIVQFASQGESGLFRRTDMSEDDFLQYAFDLLSRSLLQ